MIRFGINKLKTFFNKGHERSILTKKNVAASFAIKGITILISFLLTPLVINYANPERYGIWQVFYSMVLWMNLFDLGFGNGLKNKLAEAKAQNNNLIAKKYISSTYAILTVICIGIFVLFAGLNPFIDWTTVFPSEEVKQYESELNPLIWICISSFCLIFVLNLLKNIVTADQRPAIASFLDMIGQLFTLIILFIFSKTLAPNLFLLGLAIAGPPVMVYLIASLVFFRGRYKDWTPSIKLVDFNLAKQTMNLGLKFFVASMAALAVLQTISFLILNKTNSIEVANYNAAKILFFVLFNILGIIILPMWTSFTDAYTQRDFQWMKKSRKNLQQLFILLIIGEVILLLLAPVIYKFWIGDKLNIPLEMSMAVMIFVCALCWVNINIYPLNGIGKMKLQIYSSILEIVLIFPIASWMNSRFGAPGIVLAPVIVYIPRMIWSPIQLNKLINQTAKGIWNK